jgi:hypothetical protein
MPAQKKENKLNIERINQMNKNILEHYLEYGTYTYPGLYKDYLKSLPDDISELGNLICHQVIHRAVLKNGNTLANADKKYGDMNKFPWFRLKCDDDILMTAAAMITELFRLDETEPLRIKSLLLAGMFQY